MKRSTFIKSILTAIASLFIAPSLLKKEENCYPSKSDMKAGDKYLIGHDPYYSLEWEDSSKSKVVAIKRYKDASDIQEPYKWMIL